MTATTPTSRAPGKRLRLLVAAVGVAIVAVVAGLSFASSSNEGNVPAADVTDKEAFDLPSLTGDGRVRLADFRGHPVVVNFFASWCGPCRTELPIFARAATALSGKVLFIAVNAQELSKDGGIELAEEMGLEAAGITLARDVGGRAGSLLHDSLGRGMPINAFYDSDGKLMEVSRGALLETKLASTLRRLYGVEL